jgi:hypothetical protein
MIASDRGVSNTADGGPMAQTTGSTKAAEPETIAHWSSPCVELGSRNGVARAFTVA